MLYIHYSPENFNSILVPDSFTKSKAEKIWKDFIQEPEMIHEYNFGTINMFNEFLVLLLKNEEYRKQIKFFENGREVCVDELGFCNIRNDRLRELVSELNDIRVSRI